MAEAVWTALEESGCYCVEEIDGTLARLTHALQASSVTGQETNEYGEVLIVACLNTLDRHAELNNPPCARLAALARSIQHKLVTCDPRQHDRVSDFSVLKAVMFWCGPVDCHAALIGCVVSRAGLVLSSAELDCALTVYLKRHNFQGMPYSHETINALLVAGAQPSEFLFGLLASYRHVAMLHHLLEHGGLPDPSVAFRIRLDPTEPFHSDLRTTLGALKERWRMRHWPLIHSCLCDDGRIPPVLADIVRRYMDGEDTLNMHSCPCNSISSFVPCSSFANLQ